MKSDRMSLERVERLFRSGIDVNPVLFYKVGRQDLTFSLVDEPASRKSACFCRVRQV